MDDVAKSYGVKFPPYTPIDSLRDELGIMFGFIAACVLTVGVYYVLWQAIQRREAVKDEARRAELRARGFHHERGGYHEKMLNRFNTNADQSQAQLQFLTQPSSLHSSPTPRTAAAGARNTTNRALDDDDDDDDVVSWRRVLI
ncbi:hypothetical protein VTN96DRAFT_5168 [Rasamsonia emersonii]|uniref:Uncharacterized protein n=1 Tax=Rasamsonia emersonii (strain ATCC 16479 / CBS 393.64 / IMI 116815) TaxID=1408163 RepID=A0A0F4Z0K0_RASE3|nr:hypothetical protein T310_1915 [Rasamsonia emersonii CBS 393.64]KKA24034.1 hypothetical protein T310_1915 [Rasamsonia emersonii CBS 393.64]